MRVLVTGGGGFLGKYVVGRLLSHAETITIYDNHDPLCGGVKKPTAPRRDVRAFDYLTGIIDYREITHIVHLAAYGRNLTCQHHPSRAWDVNVQGTKNVLQAALDTGVRRVVVCSSNIVLSDQPTVYKATKQAVEELVQMYATLGVSCMGLRPSNIYGVGQSKTEYQMCAFAGLDESYKKFSCFKITGDGTQTRDWVHAGDVADAFALALDSDICGETLDICTGVQTSMNAIADYLQVPVDYIDDRPGDAKSLYSCPHAAQARLKFTAKRALREHIHEAFPSVPR
jgi:UDP-glucose 4-epimerase